MRWSDFIDGKQEFQRHVRIEFEWMRRYAYAYYRSIISSPSEADDFAQDVLELFIGRLKERGELNRSFFMHMVRYHFLDQMRARRKDVLRRRVMERHPGDMNGDPTPVLDVLAANDGRLPQVMAMNAEAIRGVFDDVLNAFKPHLQQVILQRLAGVPAREISRRLNDREIEMTSNHINVVFHKFKTIVRDRCREVELPVE